ncbi:MAG: hypothetical protein KAI79_01220 [Bacteroidales bacterium]|nr:hypothetical protein [Bacteroidales bacterium]
MIAKVNKEIVVGDMFGSMFGGGNTSKLDFQTDFYGTIEDAEEVINEMSLKLDKKTDKDWNEKNDLDQESANKQFDTGAVYQLENYIIIPVEKVVTITSVPKHRRNESKVIINEEKLGI